MYLLIQNTFVTIESIIQHLHPTMYLLIPMSEKQADHRISKFTSHYVSINSITAIDY